MSALSAVSIALLACVLVSADTTTTRSPENITTTTTSRTTTTTTTTAAPPGGAKEVHVITRVVPTAQSSDFYQPPSSIEFIDIAPDSGYRSDAKLTHGVDVARFDLVENYNITGWDDVNVSTVADSSAVGVTDVDRYYAAGYAEGYWTQRTIYYTYLVGVPPTTTSLSPANLASFMKYIRAHYAFQTTGPFNPVNKTAFPTATPFERQVGLFMIQLQGITDGYNARCAEIPGAQPLTVLDLFMLNLQPELGDIQTVTTVPSTQMGDVEHQHQQQQKLIAREAAKRRQSQLHCSALVRPTATDLFMAHTTWSGFNMMFRQYKTYNMTTSATQPIVPSSVVSFSGYPGTLSSTDDWYVTSNYLAVTETTISVGNVTLYMLYTVPQTVSEYLRVMAANALATSGEEWVRLFSTLNSGTYCNEWMVVDMKRFNPNVLRGSPVGDGTLWVADQIPGWVESRDLSDLLRTQGYFASYNDPYFRKTWDLTLNNVMEEEYGSFYSYHHYSRAEIFARDAPNVQDMAGMQTLIRSNNYKTDPLCLIPNCTGAVNNTCDPPYNPTLAVANRADLQENFGATAQWVRHYGENWQYWQPAAFGAIDAKIAAYSDFVNGKMRGTIIAGPTTSGYTLPPFDWRERDGMFLSQKPWGMTYAFNYTWIVREVPIAPLPVVYPPSTLAARTATVIVSALGFVAVVVAIGYVVVRRPRAAASDSASESVPFAK